MSPAEPAQTSAKVPSLARTYGPWLVAVLALAWVTRAVRWADLAQVMEKVPVGRFLGASAVLLAANCAADTLAMYYTFGWFGCRLRYRDLLIVRAATYLLAVVQYYVGQAAILTFLHQKRGVPIMRGGGWILFISGINMGVLVLLAAVGLVGGDGEVTWLRLVPALVGLGALLYAGVLWLKPAALVRVALLAPLFEMGIVGHIKATIIRMPHILVLIVWHYLALTWFGVNVTFLRAMVLLPAVFFAAALPISVQGLGLSQAAAVYFFAGPTAAGKAAVLAYSLAMTSVSLVCQVGLGLAFLPAARRLGMQESTASPEPAAVPVAVPALAESAALPALKE